MAALFAVDPNTARAARRRKRVGRVLSPALLPGMHQSWVSQSQRIQASLLLGGDDNIWWRHEEVDLQEIYHDIGARFGAAIFIAAQSAVGGEQGCLFHHLFAGIKAETNIRAPIVTMSAKPDRMIHIVHPPISMV